MLLVISELGDLVCNWVKKRNKLPKYKVLICTVLWLAQTHLVFSLPHQEARGIEYCLDIRMKQKKLTKQASRVSR